MQRRKADRNANREKIMIWDKASGGLQQKTWVDVKVGDLVQACVCPRTLVWAFLASECEEYVL